MNQTPDRTTNPSPNPAKPTLPFGVITLAAGYALLLVPFIGWTAQLAPWSVPASSELGAVARMSLTHAVGVLLAALPTGLAACWLAPERPIRLAFIIATPVTVYMLWSVFMAGAPPDGGLQILVSIKDAMVLLLFPAGVAAIARAVLLRLRQPSP